MDILKPRSDANWEQRVAEALDAGLLVLFPTETFYGLAARADSPEAVNRLVRLKEDRGRSPIALIASEPQVVARAFELGPLAPLGEAFWPGPLTLVVPPARGRVPLHEALQGPQGVGVRVSNHPLATRVARAGGGLVTSPSANLSGGAPPRTVDTIDPKVASQVALCVDGGRTPGDVPSTVMGLVDGAPRVFRSGAVTESQWRPVWERGNPS